MEISYIILTYKSELLIEDCIKSIQRFSKDSDFEIIVIDNSPLEQKILIQNICNKFSEPIIYVPNENNGYGEGNNVGIKRALGKIICVINPDVRFLEPFIEQVLNSFSKDKQLAMIGLKQIGGHDLSFYLKPEYYLPFLNSIVIKLFNKLNIFNSRYFFLSGACFFVSKEKFVEIGLFDERLFMYYEESDINRRFMQKNYRIKYLKEIKYNHLIDDRVSIAPPLFMHELNSLEHYMTKFRLNLKLNLSLKKIEYFFKSKLKYQILKDFIKSKKNDR